MRNTLLILSILFFSCGNKETRRNICPCGSSEKIAAFIQSSIKDANNMSDEEMEDVIEELRITAITIYCPLKTVTVNHDASVILTPIDSCEWIPYYVH